MLAESSSSRRPMCEPATCRSTRDFVVAAGPECPSIPTGVARWHSALGGEDTEWLSPSLGCRLVGPAPQVLGVRRKSGQEATLACLLVGAPVGFGSLCPNQIARAMLPRYATEGVDALRAIDGSWCGVIVDEVRGQLWLFTDRFGFRKVFTCRRGGSLLLGSSRALLGIGRGLGLELDDAGVVQVALAGHTIGARTLFRGCEAVMPATAVDMVSGASRRYWDIESFVAGAPRDEAATDELVAVQWRVPGTCRAPARSGIECDRWIRHARHPVGDPAGVACCARESRSVAARPT